MAVFVPGYITYWATVDKINNRQVPQEKHLQTGWSQSDSASGAQFQIAETESPLAVRSWAVT